MSLKKYGGFLARYDIFCVQPRKEFAITASTKDILEELGAVVIQEALNQHHRYYSMLNKPLAISYMMHNYEYDQYIFLDGDTLILNEPFEFLEIHAPILLSPVYTKGIGIANLSEKNGNYWQQLFDLKHIAEEHLPKVKTVLEEEEILPYWNAGVIVINGRTRAIEKWADFTVWLLENNVRPASGIFFTEQYALTATLLAEHLHPGKLSLSHNLPLLNNILNTASFHHLKQICIVHHLMNFDLLPELADRHISAEKISWLNDQLIEMQILKTPLPRRIQNTYFALQKTFREKFYYFIYKFTRH